MTTVTSDDEQERGGVQEILENAMNHLKGFIAAVNIARWGRLLKDGTKAAHLPDNVRFNKQNGQ